MLTFQCVRYIYLPTFWFDFSGKLVGKHTFRPMDPFPGEKSDPRGFFKNVRRESFKLCVQVLRKVTTSMHYQKAPLKRSGRAGPFKV